MEAQISGEVYCEDEQAQRYRYECKWCPTAFSGQEHNVINRADMHERMCRLNPNP